MKHIIREVLLSDDEGVTQRHEIATPDGFSGSIRKAGQDVPVLYSVDSEVWAQEGMSQQEIDERVGSSEEE
ncbi:MAG TPA: hypothetical protein VHV10_16600 [Ktedonobacteraceae bacterium]|jgi:hypothetical protein|nr:hypothetical protein [Ktedonobacteraceae bacterium]